MLHENGQKELYYNIELPWQRHWRIWNTMDLRLMFRNWWSFTGAGWKIEEIKKRIYSLAGEEFNINSPKQLGVILLKAGTSGY